MARGTVRDGGIGTGVEQFNEGRGQHDAALRVVVYRPVAEEV